VIVDREGLHQQSCPQDRHRKWPKVSAFASGILSYVGISSHSLGLSAFPTLVSNLDKMQMPAGIFRPPFRLIRQEAAPGESG